MQCVVFLWGLLSLLLLVLLLWLMSARRTSLTLATNINPVGVAALTFAGVAVVAMEASSYLYVAVDP
jgi:hypothetical protein